MLNVEGLSVRAQDALLLDNIGFSLSAGDFCMLLGPNGAGKSTLLGAICGAKSASGSIEVCGKPLRQYKPKELARRVGCLSQRYMTDYDFTVREIAAMGRYAYGSGRLFSSADSDAEAVDAALRAVDMLKMAERRLSSLSGGERQRAFLAQVFAQSPSILMLDEPASALDLPAQRELFALLNKWLDEKRAERAILCVMHDLSLALSCGNKALLLSKGKQAAFGNIREAASEEKLREVYGMDVCGYMRKLASVWE